MVRGVIWFGLAAAPIIAVHFNGVLKKYQVPGTWKMPDHLGRVINLTILIIILLLVAVSLPWFRNAIPGFAERDTVIPARTPISATQFLLSEDLPGNLFNDMGFGSYLIWAAQPKYKVYSDPRVELFDIEIWDDYGEIIRANDEWEKKLEKYEVNTLLLDRDEQVPLINALTNHQNWQLVYQDGAALIYVKTYPSP